jgi:hypothetical protein
MAVGILGTGEVATALGKGYVESRVQLLLT